jgi:membrane protein YdbS with pleckstrin-like domain
LHNEPARKLDPNAIKVWKVSGVIETVVTAGLLAVPFVLAVRFDWPIWTRAASVLLVFVTAFALIMVIPKLRWKRFRYEIKEEEIDLQHGLLILRHTLIPMIKVQHVDTKQGPILRRFGLAAVTFSTAAGSFEIPALTEYTAARVRNQIARLARISDEEI